MQCPSGKLGKVKILHGRLGVHRDKVFLRLAMIRLCPMRYLSADTPKCRTGSNQSAFRSD